MGIVKRDSITITVLAYLGAVIGYVNKILLSPNFLTEEQVGLTSILISLSMLYAQFSALGVNSTVVKFFPYFRTTDRRHHGLFFWAALAVSAGFVIFTALFLLFRAPVMAYFAGRSPLLAEYWLWLIPLGFTTLFFLFFSSWLQALHKTVISTALYDVVLRLLITVEIGLYALRLLDFAQFMAGYVLIHFVPTLILLVYIGMKKLACLRPQWNMRTRRMVTVAGIYGIWQYLGGASYFLTNVIDQTMLAGIQGLMQGGIFAVMMYMVSAMMIPNRSLVKVSAPVMANFWKERDLSGMARLNRQASIFNLVIGCFIFVMIWVNLDNIFRLLPESYGAGRYVFLFLALGRLVEMYAGLSGVILVTSKRYRYDFSLSMLLVVLTVGTNALFIPRLGMIGAALATMISLIVYHLCRVVFVRKFFRLFPFRWIDLSIPALTAALIFISGLIPYLGNFFTDVFFRSLLIGMSFLFIVYRTGISTQFNTFAKNSLMRLTNRS